MPDLKIPERSTKKSKGYYLDMDTINFIKQEAIQLSSVYDEYVSENEVLIAIVKFYKENSKV